MGKTKGKNGNGKGLKAVRNKTLLMFCPKCGKHKTMPSQQAYVRGGNAALCCSGMTLVKLSMAENPVTRIKK